MLLHTMIKDFLPSISFQVEHLRYQSKCSLWRKRTESGGVYGRTAPCLGKGLVSVREFQLALCVGDKTQFQELSAVLRTYIPCYPEG